MLGEPLPESLAREGDLMLHALLEDLARVPGMALVTSRDPRLSPLEARAAVLKADPGEDAARLFRRGLSQADLCWPIAPETGGVLERLSRTVLDAQRVLLGSRPEAVRTAASKRSTSRVLEQAGVPVIPTYETGQALPDRAGAWVLKPDDGAGCIDTYLLPDRAAALAALEARGAGFVLQPYVAGAAMSLSVLCCGGAASLLSINRQKISIVDGRLEFSGCEMNMVDDNGIYAELARSIAQAMPGLWGYVGVDFVSTQRGPVVIEINPRLTTSYAGLSAALGLNPAERVLQLMMKGEG